MGYLPHLAPSLVCMLMGLMLNRFVNFSAKSSFVYCIIFYKNNVQLFSYLSLSLSYHYDILRIQLLFTLKSMMTCRFKIG